MGERESDGMDNSMAEEEVGGETMEESEGELSSDHDGEDEKEEEEKGLLNGRKRKRKTSTHHRRKLRSKYESVDDFNPEARTAQSEELERIRRLKLQQTLTGETDSKEAEEGEEGRAAEERRKSEEGAVRRESSSSSSSPEVVVVDLTEVVEEEQNSKELEAIIIDSGSESEDDHASKSGKSQPGGASRRMEIDKLNRKYDWAEPCLDGRILVNVGHGSEEEDIFLAPQIARVAKPHQIGGIRFLYDNIIESQSRFNTSTGFGCILAHSMGLGKTLQVIAFIDIFLRHTPAKHVLCVVPVNTLQNWIAEFDCWLPIHPGEKGVVEFKTPSRPTSRRGSPLETPESKVLSGSPLHPDTAAQLSFPHSGCSSSSSSSSSSPFLRAVSPIEGSTVKSPSPSPTPVAPVPPKQGMLLSSLLFSPSTQPNIQGDDVADHAAARDMPVTAQIPHSEGSENTTPDTTYRRFKLFMLSESVRTMDARLKVISEWRSEGGVLLMGYEMYRLLALSVPSLGGNKMAVKRRKPAKNQQVNYERTTIDLEETEKEMDALIAVQQALCRPGPDLVICDEGHRIKNDGTNISQALKKIRTRRRIVMTGYPVQNNLQEYWCMVDFVRPNYLGTKHEFADLFERPITNGQCVDSTVVDVRLMRFRSHVLHALLEGFVLRRGHEILNLTLPPKFEHVLYLRPSAAQAVLYNYNIEQMQGMSASVNAGPLRAFAVCSKIWNHPDIYYTEAMAQDSNRISPTSWLDEAGLPKLLLSKSEPGSLCKIDWPSTALSDYQTGLLGNSPKMAVMMELINRSVIRGDRVLVFSQSLPTLSYVEKLLSQSLLPVPHSTSPDGTVQLSNSKWIKGRNFCRLDGSTGSMERDRLINYFNSAANTECWVFLLSTRAGCLGVNLVGANRVIVLDVSWNPCYDTQAVCRVYRYGQVKPVFIYRLVCDGTMERKIYDRQVSKQGMSDRVVDELHPERHFTVNDIITLIAKLAPLSAPPDLSTLTKFHFRDPVLAEVCQTHGHLLTKLPFKHESLLVSTDERLTDIEKYYALKGFQQDWKAIHSAPGQNYRTQQASRPQQSLMPRLPAATTTVPHIVPAVTTQVVTNLQRMPTARVDTPILFPPSNVSQSREKGGDMEVICLDSDSDEEGSSIERSSHVSSGDSLSDGTASQYMYVGGQIIGGVSQSASGAQKGSSPSIIVHQPGVLPSSSLAASNNARASPLQPPSSQSPSRAQAAQATIGSTDITSPSLATSPALAATIANILASAKGEAIRVGDMVATHTGSTKCPPSSVSSSSFATPSSEPLSDPRAHATRAALSWSIADLVQYSQQLSKLNHMRPQQGTESLTARPSSQQRTLSVVDPTPQLLTSQTQAVSSKWQHVITDSHAQATSPSSVPMTSHGVCSAPTAQPPTSIPLLSPIAAKLFSHSVGSTSTVPPFTSVSSPTALPLSSISTRMPTLVPLPSNPSSARRTAVVPPYFAVSLTGNTPTPSVQPTLSQPQSLPSSSSSTGHSQATIAPELKGPTAAPSADKGEAKPMARNCTSIVLGD